VTEAHDAGMAVMAWTADRLDEFRKLVVWGVDAIATNYPDRLIEFYQR
jgi:glycerophosphoryl diester phosphodiesterase